jgi:hypothetical protein
MECTKKLEEVRKKRYDDLKAVKPNCIREIQ